MTSVAIIILCAALVLQSFHLHWSFKQHLKLMRRVHHLEMAQDFPDYWDRKQEQIQADRWN